MRDVQTENMKNLLERDAKMDNLLDKVDAMDDESRSMRSRATSVRRKVWWESISAKIIMFFVALALLYIINGVFICGFTFEKC